MTAKLEKTNKPEKTKVYIVFLETGPTHRETEVLHVTTRAEKAFKALAAFKEAEESDGSNWWMLEINDD